jgi:hypothetical protein
VWTDVALKRPSDDDFPMQRGVRPQGHGTSSTPGGRSRAPHDLLRAGGPVDVRAKLDLHVAAVRATATALTTAINTAYP